STHGSHTGRTGRRAIRRPHGSPLLWTPYDGRRRAREAVQADLEREASASSRIAVPAPAPGRVTEQGIDAGGGAGPARRLVPRKTGTEGGPGSGSQGPVSSRSARQVASWHGGQRTWTDGNRNCEVV